MTLCRIYFFCILSFNSIFKIVGVSLIFKYLGRVIFDLSTRFFWFAREKAVVTYYTWGLARLSVPGSNVRSFVYFPQCACSLGEFPRAAPSRLEPAISTRKITIATSQCLHYYYYSDTQWFRQFLHEKKRETMSHFLLKSCRNFHFQKRKWKWAFVQSRT